MVPLKEDQIHRVVQAVREVAPAVDLHLFGFTKADSIQDFAKYHITSFDSTSPMLRAFKDGKNNYFSGDRWYTAIRVPQADENRKFKQEILAGHKDQRQLRCDEQSALAAVRAYSEGTMELEAAIDRIEVYGRQFSDQVPLLAYRETLADRRWESCPCKVCRDIGVEVVLFRGSNRNRRRGFHNLYTFHQKLLGIRMAVA